MYKAFIKRVIDIIFSIIIIPILFIVFIIVGIYIKAEDKGSVFYKANRLGKHGKIFKMYKFRSMKMNAKDIRNADGTTFNSENDERLTSIGKFLRKTSIDELPQIINVLKGDMSFIGPRPDLPDAMNIYKKEDRIKLGVLPGISGYSQAFYRNTSTLEERFKGDVYYATNISFMLDLKILIKTLHTVINRKNVYRN